MKILDSINSDAYWNNRFAKNWESCEGPAQSHFFAKVAIEHLPSWLLTEMRRQTLTIADWGSAQGDGTNVWASYIDAKQITGVDFSAIAIEQAMKRYPSIRFIKEDWLTEDNSLRETFDIVFSSNTLEHFHQPYEVLQSISSRAKKAIVLALPYKEVERIDEHFFSFLPENIPLQLAAKFRLIWARVVDCRILPSTYWNGEQIILVYIEQSWLDSLGLALSDLRIEQLDTTTELTQLKTTLTSLHQAIADRDAQIANLDLIATELSAVKSDLDIATQEYNRVMESNSMKITSFARILRGRLQRGQQLVRIFMSIARSQGPRYALSKAIIRFKQTTGRGDTFKQITISNQERYLIEKTAQNSFLEKSLAAPLEETHLNLIQEYFKFDIDKLNKVVIYPLSYPMELTQRPDHILRYFSELGFLCIIITIDNNTPFVKEIAPKTFLTNLFAGIVSFFSNKIVVFYITFPFYSYILNHLKRSLVIYDVLDDLSVFSLYCEAMKSDHKDLLSRSDFTFFSSQELLDSNRADTHDNSFLISNGVWKRDFENDSTISSNEITYKTSQDEYVIGYHGAISELLDWSLLEKLVKIPRVRLVLIGPVIEFDDSIVHESRILQNNVLTSPQVTHVQPIPYSELKHHLNCFDAAIIPFLVNEKTNPVSPLKLFEYMAVGLRIFATNTKTLSRYSNYIFVANEDNLPTLIAQEVNNRNFSPHRIDYSKILNEVDWGRQLDTVFPRLEETLISAKNKSLEAKKVDIVNVNFYDWDGITLYKGGAERYVYDLACILKAEGYQPRIIQHANKPFNIDFQGIPVIGIQTNSGHDLRGMSMKYRDICKDSDLVIASPADLACELSGLLVIGINHGIYWDHKFKKLDNANLNEYRNIFNALKISSTIVAVDTNFINWVRTFDYSLGGKITYIPNYFDSRDFSPIEKNFDGNITILYPRRLYEARGIFLTLKAFDYLFEKHGTIKLHLVGQASPEDAEIVHEFIEKHPGRVVWDELDMGEMWKPYQQSHIALVPTIYSEGTSLSCLEAMATNNAVIATNIGGLPNLVVDGFNGLLIKPTVEALIQSIESLLLNRMLMQEMASNGVNLAKVFEKNRWTSRWLQVITEVSK